MPIKETLRLTAEADSAGKESQDFSNLVLNRTAEDAVEGWYSVALAKSKGSISSRVLKVAKGDQLSLSTRATYDQEKIATLAVGNAPANRWGSVALAAGGLLAVQDVSIGGETKSKSLNFNFLAAVPFVKTLFSPKIKTLKTPPSGVGGLTPKGYVEIAVYKDSLCTELVSVKQLPITDKGAYFWEFLQDSVSFDTDGFAVVSLRNESDKSVLFDDLRVDLFGTAEAIIVQENHYEPFGMTLRGLDYVLNPAQKNNFLYQSKEKEEDLGLEMYDFHARNYDPQIGRTNQIDPHADTYQGLSPYSWVANNPIRLKDPTGKDWGIEEKKEEGIKFLSVWLC